MVKGCRGCGCLQPAGSSRWGGCRGCGCCRKTRPWTVDPNKGVWGGRTADQRRLSRGTTGVCQHSRPKCRVTHAGSEDSLLLLLAELHGLQGLSSPTRDGMCVPDLEAQRLNQWTTRFQSSALFSEIILTSVCQIPVSVTKLSKILWSKSVWQCHVLFQ